MKRIKIGLVFLLVALLSLIGGFKLSKMPFEGRAVLFLDAGHEALKKHEYITAIANFNKAIALDPESSLAHLSLADAYYSIGQHNLALDEYNIVAQLLKHDEKTMRYVADRIEKIKKERNP